MPKKAPESTTSAVEIPPGEPTIEWTVAQLRAFAATRDVDLGKLRTKPQILDLILDAISTPEADPVTVLEAVTKSIAKAIELKVIDPEVSAAPIAALRVLAQRIDDADTLADFMAVYASNNNLRPPSADNVSIPTFLKYCEALGLTAPKVTAGTGAKPEAGEQGGGSKLGNLRQIHGKGA